MEGRLEQSGRIPQDGDVGRIRGEKPGDLTAVKTHVVTNDVKTGPRAIILHLGMVERRWVVEVVPSVWKGKLQPVLLTETEKNVE